MAYATSDSHHPLLPTPGLQEVERECTQLGISFHLLPGPASTGLVQFVKEHQAGAVVTDFSPLRVPRQWLQDVIEALPKDVSVCQVRAVREDERVTRLVALRFRRIRGMET